MVEAKQVISQANRKLWGWWWQMRSSP